MPSIREYADRIWNGEVDTVREAHPIQGMWLTAEEVADALAVSVTLVRQLTLEGTLPCRRIGRLVRYATADIEFFIADRENHHLR